jgi:hypothetical protein
VPVNATYSQHEDAEKCSWSVIEKYGSHPVVYVARDSHASYFKHGSYLLSWLPGVEDHANGDSEHVGPRVSDFTDASKLLGSTGPGTGVELSPMDCQWVRQVQLGQD